MENNLSAAEQEEHWESKIREQGYKKPGEKQVVVLPSEKQEQATSTEKESFWSKIKETFSNLINL